MLNQISRVKRSKSEARKNYNRLSRLYDYISGPSEEKYRVIGIEMLNLGKGERVLEIGFGTGNSLVAFGKSVGENGWVVGVDLSDGMCKIAKQKIEENQLKERTLLSLADGVTLPFCQDYFDAVFMSFTLELFDTVEIPLVLDECRRILKTSGRIVNLSLSKSIEPGPAENIYEWFHARLPVLIDCRPIFPMELIASAGFKINIREQMKMWGLPLEIISADLLD